MNRLCSKAILIPHEECPVIPHEECPDIPHSTPKPSNGTTLSYLNKIIFIENSSKLRVLLNILSLRLSPLINHSKVISLPENFDLSEIVS